MTVTSTSSQTSATSTAGVAANTDDPIGRCSSGIDLSLCAVSNEGVQIYERGVSISVEAKLVSQEVQII